ncbi:MAG: hypothetical protein HY300_08970 [Verrucomicrobia bacterium]|nr:hypothetical protein [Verrucomicrobiota bacterium]
MPEQARITSVEALEAFKANLLIYLSKARPTLEEVSSDVQRIRLWLQHDQRLHWEGQMRRRLKNLEEAQQALATARLANFRDARTAEVMAVRRAKHAVEEAETKLKILKKWDRDFDSQMLPLARHLEKLHTYLANGLPKAVAYLTQVGDTLDAYADRSRPVTTAETAQPAAAGGTKTNDIATAPQESPAIIPAPGKTGSPTGEHA